MSALRGNVSQSPWLKYRGQFHYLPRNMTTSSVSDLRQGEGGKMVNEKDTVFTSENLEFSEECRQELILIQCIWSLIEKYKLLYDYVKGTVLHDQRRLLWGINTITETQRMYRNKTNGVKAKHGPDQQNVAKCTGKSKDCHYLLNVCHTWGPILKCFTYIISFHPHSNPMRFTLLLVPFSRWKN